MQHLRSKEKRRERDARRFILDTSFHDRNNADTISLVTQSMVVAHLDALYPDTPPPTLDMVKGEVLIDSRGDGSFQK